MIFLLFQSVYQVDVVNHNNNANSNIDANVDAIDNEDDAGITGVNNIYQSKNDAEYNAYNNLNIDINVNVLKSGRLYSIQINNKDNLSYDKNICDVINMIRTLYQVVVLLF